jgi:hypothetical protein
MAEPWVFLANRINLQVGKPQMWSNLTPLLLRPSDEQTGSNATGLADCTR